MIKEGDYVIAKVDALLRVTTISKDRPLLLGKRKIFISSAIGHPYGTFFEVQNNGKLSVQATHLPREISVASSLSVKDNRSLCNSNDSQKLTTRDIEAFKDEGLPGDEIVKMIVENSSSFDGKSSYSQEKYLRKKQRKYMTVVQILQPNTRLVAETFYSYSPQKICNLRMDSLSQMLTFCNVFSGGKYIVVDSVLGLLTGAVLERIGNAGLALQLFLSPSPANVASYAIDILGFSRELREEVLVTASLQKTLKHMEADDSVKVSTDNVSEDGEDTDMHLNHPVSERHKARKLLLTKAKRVLLQKNMDGLLVACKHHPAVTVQLLDYLAYSRPFALYSMYLEPLVDCYASLKSRGDVIMLNVSETWLRKYQILPERTHPEYSMSGNGGFLLTGIKVENKS